MESDIYEMMGTRAEGPPGAQPFDKRAWAERKRQERQEAFARADAAALRANSDPAALESYLRVAAALPHHSATNILLIADRMPGATRVGTADHWRRLGAAVKRGEKAIHIIEPTKEYVRDDGSIGVLYDVRKVFDVSQTTARARLPRKADPHAPARIEPSDDLGGPSAEYDHAAGVIRVQRGLDEPQLLRALTTEAAHAAMARGGEGYDRDARAAQADLAANIVARRLGLGEPAALAPPAPPGADAREVRAALDEIGRAARDLSDRMAPPERGRERSDAR